jgi:hypothetical protein
VIDFLRAGFDVDDHQLRRLTVLHDQDFVQADRLDGMDLAAFGRVEGLVDGTDRLETRGARSSRSRAASTSRGATIDLRALPPTPKNTSKRHWTAGATFG